MSALDLDRIVFPENIPPPGPRKVAIPPALRYITRLLYGSGTTLSVVYLLLIFIIQPLLEVQYERRNELMSHTLGLARKILVKLDKNTRLPVVAVKRGEKYYSDAQVQTVETNHRNTMVTFEDETTDENLLKSKLESLKGRIEDYNRYHAQIDELNPLTFQVRKFQGRIDAYSQSNLLRAKGQIAGDLATKQLKQDIRDIKGLFLTGQV